MSLSLISSSIDVYITISNFALFGLNKPPNRWKHINSHISKLWFCSYCFFEKLSSTTWDLVSVGNESATLVVALETTISFSFYLDSSMIFLSVCMVENTLLHLFWELQPMWESSICVLLFSSVVWWSPPIHFHFMSVLVVLLTHSATSVVTHSLNIQFHHIMCWFARRVMMTKWFCDVGLPKNHS